MMPLAEFKAWADTLTPGEEIALTEGYTAHSIARVLRLTASQVLIAGYNNTERRFRRHDGYEVGRRERFRTPKIVPLTPEIRETIERAALASWVEGLVRHGNTKLSLRVMRAMKAAHDREVAAEAAGPKWPTDKFSERQRAWCERYERETDFEPQMDDYIAGNQTFVEAAQAAVTWFETHTSDQYLRMSEPTIPGSEFDNEGADA